MLGLTVLLCVVADERDLVYWPANVFIVIRYMFSKIALLYICSGEEMVSL